MERHGEEVDVTTNEARGGSTPHIVRYVLAISLVLAVIAMSIVWMTGAASVDNPTPSGSELTANQAQAGAADGSAAEQVD
ncbi:hypothetical protein EKN06_00300 [Croceicoccus ponticola]|uniref:Uncharacterized protein n=1 Tax=Croceicoccus ponticola TaxID=2217664 RepID=A0A437GZF2_9SPHN|nr:hypothetical protein [Croceicoccus ponticola]RVQ68712.1 hypothetical protein EKN06_00300 [Croceicoccus ponticola]